MGFSGNIDGVRVLALQQIPDERGIVKKFIDDSSGFHFGEVYFTTIYSGIIKGLHGYYTKDLWYCVPSGMVKLVLWDNRPESKTKDEIMEIFTGEQDYMKIFIPHGVMNAFYGIAPYSLIAVMANEKFSEARTIRMRWDDTSFPYDWFKVK